MSRSVEVAWSETTEELEGRYRAERDVERRKRLCALWRVRAGDRVAAAGRVAGVGGRTVERWLGWYRAGGLADVLRRVPGHGAVGQPHRLTAEQRAGVLARCARGEFRTFEEARAWVEVEYGVAYRPGGLYTALRRLGVRPKVPRPVAERADPAAREAWKQGG
jgi:transposase